VRLNPLLKQLEVYPQEALNRKKAEVRARGLTLYDFGTGDPIEPTPQAVREAIIDAVPVVSQYPKVRGPEVLRQAIADYLERRFGVALGLHRIVPTSGSKEAVFHMPLLVIDPAAEDRVVVFPDPGYAAYKRGCLFAGGIAHPVELGGDFRQRFWDVPPEILAKTRMLWINTPHNPSGAFMSRDELRRTWEVCREYDILLCSDECYADVYDDEPPPSLLEVADEGVLVFHSLSKRSGMTGYRSGFVAGDAAWIQALVEFRVNPGLVPQDTVNAGATVAWADDDHPALRREVFGGKKAHMRALFEELGLEVVASEATFYLWLRCPPGVSDTDYALALLDAGIVVSPGSTFGLLGAGAGYIRVAMVPPLEVCQQACKAWREVHTRHGWATR
jgi:LL-diaminopimelate aminotransferase